MRWLYCSQWFLQAQYDKLKRKALLGGAVVGKDGVMPLGNQSIGMQERQEDPNARLKHGYAAGIGGTVGLDVGAVVGNMEAAGVCQMSSGSKD